MKYKVIRNFKALQNYFITGQVIEGKQAEDLNRNNSVRFLIKDGLIEEIKSDLPKEEVKEDDSFKGIIEEIAPKKKKKRE